MGKREDTRDWMIANCLNCGRPFGQEEAWMDECPICFKEKRNYNLLKGDLAFAALQYEIERLRSAKANPAPVEDGNVERLQEEVEGLSAEAQRLTTELEKSERKRQKMRLRVRELEGEVERLRSDFAAKSSPVPPPGAAIDLPLLRKMLLLCHPDTNPNNLPSANEVTQWLLSYKSTHLSPNSGRNNSR